MGSFQILPAVLVGAIGFFLIALQAIAAYSESYLHTGQKYRPGLVSYTLTQHGGAWSDLLVITPLLVWICGWYEFRYLSVGSIAIFVISVAVWWWLAQIYQENGKFAPEAYTHEGRTTPAGWLHLVYAVLATWILAMTFLPGMAIQEVSAFDLVLTGIALTLWAVFGVMKFSHYWRWDPMGVKQVVATVTVIWLIVIIRLW